MPPVEKTIKFKIKITKGKNKRWMNIRESIIIKEVKAIIWGKKGVRLSD